MKIFGMGGLELVIILVVILLIFGPKNLPKLGNALGKTVSNLRSGMNAGKKKKEEEEAAEAGEEAAESAETAEAPKPAEIEGEVEEVIPEPAVIEEPAIDSAVAEEAAPAAPVVPEPVSAEPVPAEPTAANEPKKVKRVVKKKVSTE